MSPVLSTFSGASARAFGFGYSLAASAFEHIETQTVGAGGAASVTFSSIPGTYKHLQIRGIARENTGGGTNVGSILVRFNGDSGSNYSLHRLFGNGTSATSDSATSAQHFTIACSVQSGGLANVFGAAVMDILDYANTSKYKTARILDGADQNTTGQSYVFFQSGLWMSTSAVTSLSLILGNSFAQYSSFSLYGVKA